MRLFSIFTDHKQRFLTGIILIAIVTAIGLINNFFVIWLFFGIVYIFSFYEAMRLFKIDNNQMYAYAVGLWLLALIYPNPDDLIFVVLILFVSVMVYTQKVDF